MMDGSLRAWVCPECQWEVRAHPVYGWAKWNDGAVDAHKTKLCPGRSGMAPLAMDCCCDEILEARAAGGEGPRCGSCACCAADVDPAVGGCVTAAVEAAVEGSMGGA